MPSLAFLGYGMYGLTGWGVSLWPGTDRDPGGIVPAIDLVVGLDHADPPDDVIEALEADRYYLWIASSSCPCSTSASSARCTW